MEWTFDKKNIIVFFSYNYIILYLDTSINKYIFKKI